MSGLEIVSLPQAAWFGAILFLAAAVQSITGFGFGLLALALLGLVMDVRGASAAIAVVALFLNLLLFAKYWRAFRLQRVWPMIVATAVFAPVGVIFLERAPSGSLLVVLGLVMLASFFQMRFAPSRARQPWHPVYLGVPCGVVGGWVGGAFGTGGPPLVAFLITQEFPMPRYVASLQVAFGLSAAARVASLAQTGFFTPPTILQITAGCGAALIGMAVGLAVAKAAPKTALATGTVWFFGLMGGYYVLKGLMR